MSEDKANNVRSCVHCTLPTKVGNFLIGRDGSARNSTQTFQKGTWTTRVRRAILTPDNKDNISSDLGHVATIAPGTRRRCLPGKLTSETPANKAHRHPLSLARHYSTPILRAPNETRRPIFSRHFTADSTCTGPPILDDIVPL